jgi:ChpA-C
MSRIRMAAAMAAMVGGLVFAGAGAASADAGAYGEASNSPGVLSGNVVQVPIDVDANVCGNSLNVLGALNPAFGNSCSNDSGSRGDLGNHEGYGHDTNVNDDSHQGWAPEGWHHHGYDHGRGDEDCC